MRAVDKRIVPVQEPGAKSGGKLSPFLGYKADVAAPRVVMWLDPTLIDLPEFRRWADRTAERANKAAHVRGPQLTVTVQRSCFTAREVAEVKAHLKGTRRTSTVRWVLGNVGWDGRIHAFFTDRDKATAIQNRVGPVLAAHIDGGCGPRVCDRRPGAGGGMSVPAF